MKEVGKIWMNGRLVPFKDAKVHVLTHALHYSTAVFEGIRCYDTPKGSAIFRLPEHVDSSGVDVQPGERSSSRRRHDAVLVLQFG
ncbi:MAG: hypothetical protein LV468_03760, partial [Candidatus Nitrosotenuis sp.]|nr:hypothetical protein [Candidatus Nitrosotenuis sp.]